MKKFMGKLFIFGSATLLLAACGNESTEEAESESEETTWEDIEEEGVLTVGTTGTFSPITYVDEDNNLTGFEVEILREVGEVLDVEVEFEPMDFDSILPALRNGQIDVAANDMAITEERLEIFDFTTPHKHSYGSAIIRAEDEDQFGSAYDLEGANVGLGSLTSNYAIFAENIDANPTAYDGGTDAILRDILNGNQDAYLNGIEVVETTLEEFGDDRLTMAEDVKYHPTSSGFTVLKGNTSLEETISGAVEELLEDGTLSEISEEFLDRDATEPLDEDEDIVSLEGE